MQVMANSDLSKKLMKLSHELENSDEKIIVDRCQSILQIYNIFLRNHDLLNDHLSRHSDLYINKGFANPSLRHRFDRSKYMNDLDVYLHNFIASAKSLIDLSRKHYRNTYKTVDKFPEYQDEIDLQFKGDPLSAFIQELRNFILHKQIPSIVTQQVHDAIKNETKLNLFFDRKALVESGFDWNVAAKQFISKMKEDEEIQGIFASYFNKIVSFHGWYHKKQYATWKKEFDWVNSKSEEISRTGIELGYGILLNKQNINSAYIL